MLRPVRSSSELLEPVRPGTAGAAPRQHFSDLGDPDEFALEGVVEHLLELVEADERRHVEEGAGGAGDRKAAADPDVLAVEVLGAVRADPGVPDRGVAVDENVDRASARRCDAAQAREDGRRDVAETGRQRRRQSSASVSRVSSVGAACPTAYTPGSRGIRCPLPSMLLIMWRVSPAVQKLPAGDPSALTRTDLRGLLIPASPHRHAFPRVEHADGGREIRAAAERLDRPRGSGGRRARGFVPVW